MKSKYLLAVFAGMIGATMLFSGCGGGDGGSGASIIGTWTWSRLTITGITLDTTNPNNPIAAGGSTTITPAWIAQVGADNGVPGISVSLTATFAENNTMTVAGSITVPGQGSQAIPPTPPIVWAESGDALSVTSEGVTVNLSHTVTDSKLTVSANFAQLQQIFADAAASQGMTPAQAQQQLENLAAQYGVTVGQLPSISVSIEFTR